MAFACLSVRQPFAWLLSAGIKDIENRTWTTEYRGPLLIHASSIPAIKPLWKLVQKNYKIKLPDILPKGGIVGIVDLIDVVTAHKSPWFRGPYGFVVKNAEHLPFVPLTGQQRIFITNLKNTEALRVINSRLANKLKASREASNRITHRP